MILVKLGITDPDSLAKKRPYIIIGAFVLGMLMTPPDIFSQTLLAVPVWLLFEVGLYCSRYVKSSDSKDESDEDEASEADETTPTLPSTDN